MIKVAINGFGRIGRITTRHLLRNKNINIVAINDLTDIDTLAHLFKYDSAQGTFEGTVEVKDGNLVLNGDSIKVFAERDPADLPWKAHDIDVVAECTGRFRDRPSAGKHLEAGAKKVALSAPTKDTSIPSLVMGVNDEILTADVDIVSNASCTTNCAAPVIKLIQDEYGIDQAVLNTIHAYTAAQKIQDAPHRDLRRARAAAVSIIPTTTGAAKAVEIVIPELEGKLEGMATRVPVPVGSFTDLVIMIQKDTTADEVNAYLKAASQEAHLKDVLQYTEDPIVSADIVGNPYSSILDAQLTKVYGRMLKIGAWYDNEYGYSARLAQVMDKMGSF